MNRSRVQREIPARPRARRIGSSAPARAKSGIPFRAVRVFRGRSLSTPLTAQLRAEIERSGPLPFHRFMAAALYDPAHGYYASGRAAIGRGGDFYTSVSVGPLFGALLARQFAEMWTLLGEPGDFDIVEQGAHRGDFAHDALTALRRDAPRCFEAARYTIVEPFAAQRTAQHERLTAFGEKVRWLDETPDAISGVHFSNELIDAFPVDLVVWRDGAWREKRVALDGERFVFTEHAIESDALRTHIAQFPTALPEGFTAEVNLAAREWIGGLAARLSRGFVLAIDYGHARDEFFAPERRNGTLTGYSQHRRVDDPLADPGDVDLTSHVDFTTLAECAEAAGLRLAGFTDQHHLAVGLSRLHFADTTELTREREREMREFKTLMHPQMMGRSFKAIAFAKDAPAALAGFAFARDPRTALGLR